MSINGLVRQLIARKNFGLAVEISDFLKFPTHDIYTEWAISKVSVNPEYKIKTSQKSSNIYPELLKKLSILKGLSFTKISKAAYYVGESEVALKVMHPM